MIGTITGREGKTIHRLASAKFNKLPDFEKGSNNKLNSDVVIIDELGMLDMMTFASLLTALKDDVKIIMLGDINQLNPIQSNNIISLMKNIIDKNISKSIKITELKNNYRSEDVINKLAMKVLDKKSNELIYENFEIKNMVNFSNDGYQVITNTNDMAHKINMMKSESKSDVSIGQYVFDVNDKVMIVKNDKRKEVYNGDILTLNSFDDEYIFLSKDNGDIISFDYADAYSSIKPAWAITIHKSQGSEYDKVAIGLDDKKPLLNINLLYTALTRAKNDVKICKVDGVDVNLLSQPAKELNSHLIDNIQ